MTTLADNLSRLTPEQRRLLEARLRKKGIAMSRVRIPARDRDRDAYPLSFAQRRLWFLHQFDPASSVYNISTPMRLRGEIDPGSLERALDALVERHEVLRTTFSTRDGEPVQVVHEAVRQALPSIDVSALPRARRESEARRLASEAWQRPFDLERGPLLRTARVGLGGDDHVILLAMHHIVSDGWSLAIFYRELLRLYQAFRRGETPSLEPLPVQYVDFALWQEEWFRGEVYETQLDFWKRQLEGLAPVLPLPTDRPRPPVMTNHGHSVRFSLPEELAAGLRRLAREQSATPFVVLLAGWSAVLARWTGVDDVAVGSPVAGRNREEIEGLIGFFVNTLVLRADLSTAFRGESFRTLVERLREVNAEANAHQDLPFEKLVDELAPERSLGHSPLFQVSLSFQSDPGGGARSALEDVHVSAQASENPVAMFDLALMLTETPKQVTADLIYNTDLFDRTTAARLSRRFTALLEAAAERPDEPVAVLSAPSPSERQQLLVEWNTGAPVLRENRRLQNRCLHEVFAELAREAPERPALVFEGGETSYGDLLERSLRLARHLHSLGVGPETIVALAVDRSPEVVVGILGILAAGGAYLPIEPSYPAERVSFVLADSGAPLVVTQRSLAGRFEGGTHQLVVLGELPEPPAVDLPAVSADQTAYVIYTSGSTGRPKGVPVSHRHVGRLFAATAPTFGFGAGDTWTLFHSHAFDFSVWEIWGALLHGGRLVVVPYEVSRSPADFHELLAREGVTVLNQTPSAFLQLIRTDASSRRELALRWVIFGGEALELAALGPWFERHGDVRPRLVNMYGITETTVHVTERPLSLRDVEAGRGSVLGRPMADLRILLLDRRLEPVPLGAHGEVCVGGAGVARGYLRRPGLTARRFVPAPDAGPGERLYRSGDLARWLPEGDLVYLGRIDHQVKVRGFRVELGEIEAALARHAAVREAVVTVREDGGDARLVAYLVGQAPPADGLPTERELREALAATLPDHMIPSAFVELEALPLTAHGKVDRKALPAPGEGRLETDSRVVAPRNEVESEIAALWREVLGLEEVGVESNFFDLGGHSLLLVRLQERLRESFSRTLTVVDLFRHPTVAAQAGLFKREPSETPPETREAPRRKRRESDRSPTDVAVVGLTCRYPESANADELWENLRRGVECIHFYTDEELRASGAPRARLEHPDFVPAGARLVDTDHFDAGLFGISPREAEIIDPQQRLLLECAWEVLEIAGYDPETYPGEIGVFAGVGLNHYLLRLLADPELKDRYGFLPLVLGNAADYLTTRLSYKLNLTGPSVNVQTACSTSLVATHLACQSLLRGECDLALAGGVTVTDPRRPGHVYEEGGVSSPDGHNRTFDARAGGSAGGSGAGIVALKRLADALADGDTVYALVKGTAVNNDGSAKVGFTAPSVEGQARVISEALAAAGVDPATVAYVEAHGTATRLGDPIEVAALREVFGPGPEKHCALGSIKSNLGHTDTAAGVAGLIKTVLALKHRQIPPSLHFEEPNPEIDFEKSPFWVPTELVDWPAADGAPRRAGVSAFGLGGTNAHAVLEEAPEPEPSGPSRPWQLVALSAATATALEASTERLAAHLGQHPEDDLADVAFTLQVGRRRLAHRRILIGRDTADAAEALGRLDPVRIYSGVEERSRRPVAFLLPGVGDHSVGMGRELYETEPTFRAEIDRAAEILEPLLGEDLRTVLYPEDGEPFPSAESPLRNLLGRAFPPGGRTARDESPAAQRLERTRFAQPAVFAVEHALARLFLEWGLAPESMIGYSLGEYTAACLAGVMSLEDALVLVAERARLIDELPAGAMLAVPLPTEETEALLGSELSVAAANGPQVTVVAGPEEAVAALEEELTERYLVCQRLRTAHAFHSPMMRPAAEALTEAVRKIELRAPRIPYLSNVTGTWITDAEATDPEYWARHLCGTVRFTEGLGELFAGGDRILLEVGPGQALATSARQHPSCLGSHVVLSSLGDVLGLHGESRTLLGTLGRLWISGAAFDPNGFWRNERRRRLPLPTYPFERRKYAIEPRTPSVQGLQAARRRTSGKIADLADWFYVPSWRPTVPPRGSLLVGQAPPDESAGGACPTKTKTPWLLFVDGRLGPRLASQLTDNGGDVVTVVPGPKFSGVTNGAATLDPGRRDDYVELIRELHESGRPPRKIVHLWTLEASSPSELGEIRRHGVESLLSLSRALAREAAGEEVELTVVSSQLHVVDGRGDPCPEKATLLGALKVIPQEYRNLVCRSVDLEPSPARAAYDSPGREPWDLRRLLAELVGPRPREPVVAWRGAARWAQSYEPLRLPPTEGPDPVLRRQGVYVIFGGFGKVGRILSRHLAESLRARLVLTGRTPLPERAEWDAYLEGHGESDPVVARIRQVRSLVELGAEVLPLEADATDRERTASVLRRTRERFGAVHGVVYLAGTLTPEKLFVPIDGTGPEICDLHFDPKVRGLRVLEEVLSGEDLDFCAVFSSIASVLGGLGFAAYAAANAFVDAFVEERSRSGGFPWIALNWDGWREAGEERPAEGLGAASANLWMTPEESCEAFHRSLAMLGRPRLAVSVGDLETRLDQWVRFSGADDSGSGEKREAAGGHPRPHLHNPYVEPRTDTERSIAGIWQELLGIEEVGVHDNFFELGGDSLLGTQLISRLRQSLHLDLPMMAFFQAPTVARLAEAGEANLEQKEEVSEIEAALRKIKGLSVDEIREQLRERS